MTDIENYDVDDLIAYLGPHGLTVATIAEMTTEDLGIIYNRLHNWHEIVEMELRNRAVKS